MFSRTQLPYDKNALEPFIDEKTMELHSEKHHQTYVDKLNAALESHPELFEKTLEELVSSIDSLPEDIRTAVKNHGGGTINHNIFFTTIAPNKGGEPSGKIAEIIARDFEDFNKFKEEFNKVAVGVFGSGWAWLALDKDGKSHLHGLPNQENPLMHGHTPLLGLDVWEHAYYLKYQNRRAEYIDAFWNIINWDVVNEKIV